MSTNDEMICSLVEMPCYCKGENASCLECDGTSTSYEFRVVDAPPCDDDETDGFRNPEGLCYALAVRYGIRLRAGGCYGITAAGATFPRLPILSRQPA